MEFSRTDRIIKSRKEHACDYCASPIPVGSSYFKFVAKSDGDFYTLNICDECDKMVQIVSKDIWEYQVEGVPINVLSDLDIYEHCELYNLYKNKPVKGKYLSSLLNHWDEKIRSREVLVK